jgi:hypothetical protein
MELMREGTFLREHWELYLKQITIKRPRWMSCANTVYKPRLAY